MTWACVSTVIESVSGTDCRFNRRQSPIVLNGDSHHFLESSMMPRLFLCLSLLGAATALAQVAPTRTWPELKDAVQDRVNRNAYPLTGYDKEEVREGLSRIHSLDRDEWARSGSEQGDRHLAQAKSAQAAGERSKAREAYLAAWRYYGFGAWPTQNSEGKREAHRRATAAFRAYAALAEPAIEVLRAPFEGNEIIAYLQLPAAARAAPLVMSVGGLDSYKEYVVEQYGPGYLGAGLGYLAIDMPGTRSEEHTSELQ